MELIPIACREASSVLSNHVDGLQSLQIFVFSQHITFPDLHSNSRRSDVSQILHNSGLIVHVADYM